jgi:hypothetical protein
MTENVSTPKEVSPPAKKAWHQPGVTELGNLRAFVQATNPGKPSFGIDGGGGGAGEEMFMNP